MFTREPKWNTAFGKIGLIESLSSVRVYIFHPEIQSFYDNALSNFIAIYIREFRLNPLS